MKLNAQIDMLAETRKLFCHGKPIQLYTNFNLFYFVACTDVQLAYEEVLRSGTQLQEALLQANPTTAGMTRAERQSLADHTYVHSVFGAMNKSK